jgi:putative flavoprotein involved in K+ transport
MGGARSSEAFPAICGMYLMGMPFLRRRKSALIDGAAADARELSDHLAGYLAGRQMVMDAPRVA